MGNGSAAELEATPLARHRAAWSVARRVQVGRWRVRYREAGAGPGMVLVHGLGISADFWAQNAPVLAAAGYRVVAPDLPGFGRTAGPAGGLRVEEQAACALAIATALEVGPAVYLGHSISCRTVLQIAAATPEAVRGLVLGAPTEPGGVGMMARQAGRLFLDAWRERPALLALATMTYLQAGPVRCLRTWKWGVARDPLAIAPAVAAPSLVLLGTRDPVVPESFARRLAATLPAGRFRHVEGAAHSLSFDEPAECNRILLEFLAEVWR